MFDFYLFWSDENENIEHYWTFCVSVFPEGGAVGQSVEERRRTVAELRALFRATGFPFHIVSLEQVSVDTRRPLVNRFTSLSGWKSLLHKIHNQMFHRLCQPSFRFWTSPVQLWLWPRRLQSNQPAPTKQPWIISSRTMAVAVWRRRTSRKRHILMFRSHTHSHCSSWSALQRRWQPEKTCWAH